MLRYDNGLPVFRTNGTRTPAPGLGCLGCPSAGSAGCGGCTKRSLGCVGCAGAGTQACMQCPNRPSRGLGDAITDTLSSLDWKTWAIVAVAAILAYHFLFGEKATERRRALRAARATYKGQVAKIKAGL